MHLTKSEVKTLGFGVAAMLPFQIWIIVASFRQDHPIRFKALGWSIAFWLYVAIAVWVTKRFGKS